MKPLAIALGLVLCLANAHARTAPSFRGKTTDGKTAALVDALKTDKFVFLSFWATWCEPCIRELTLLSNHLNSGTGALPVELLTVNVNTAEDVADVKPTLKMNQFRFPVVLDPTHSIFSKYNESKTLPYSVLINSQGEILQTYNGYDEALVEKLRKEVTRAKVGG